MSDIMDNPAVKKYGVYVGVGLVALYFFYSYMGSSSSSTSSSGATSTPANIAALQATAIQDQTQLQLAQLAASSAETVASINAQASGQTYGTLAGLQAYTTNIGAAQNVANTAIAATSNEAITGYNALASGFSNYIVGTSNEIATAAAATSNIASSNNATGLQVAADIASIAKVVAAFEGGGTFSFGGSNYGASQYGVMQGLQTLPTVVGQPNTVYVGGNNPVIGSSSGGG